MRAIKFRAWDTTDKYMFEVKQINVGMNVGDPAKFTVWEENEEDNRADGNYLVEHYGDTVELMQFTGLKDKNGKEIYEGDIVNEFRKSRSYPEGRNIKRVIAWHDDMTLDDSYGETAVGFNMFGGELEVIGNIYEHSHLLEEVA